MNSIHLDDNGEPKYTNRLIANSSPYLLQHAHNPIDWYPWGVEAFQVASQQDKPVFLSVGYSTCHWCHVMERETFNDEGIAEYLNQHFVCIKLDREQRPDIDDIYMTGLQLMTGQGGWPMSLFMTPEGKPFFSGTYLAPDAFLNLAREIERAWQKQRDEVNNQAEQFYQAIERHNKTAEQAVLDEGVVKLALNNLRMSYDANHGGFGRAPKFPNESQLWLIWQCANEQDGWARNALLHTLQKMSQGGLHDQVDGGFHRYSVDEKWLVPHFEKMLYNQGQLLRLYAAGYQQSGDRALLGVIEQTLAYLAREMTASDGGFYSATDADSEGEEGKYFVWSFEALAKNLTPEELSLMQSVFGVTTEGNFGTDNVLFVSDSTLLTTKQDQIERLKEKLRALRRERVKPFLDEKIIAGWNGLTIASIAQAELLTGISGYRELALAAAKKICEQQIKETADSLVIWRSRLGDEVSIPGTLEDYAYLADAFLNLALLTNDAVWRERGERLIAEMNKLFWDDEEGGYLNSAPGQDGPLIVRTKTAMDTAMPSGNSVALSALILAFEATGDVTYKHRLERLISAYSGAVALNPMAYPYFLSQVERYRGDSKYITQWACAGRVWVALTKAGAENNGAWSLVLKIAPEWHLNHPDVSTESGLLGLEVTGARANYPAPRHLDVAFSHEPIPVLEGELKLPLAEIEGPVTLRLQLCSDEVCLAPEEIQLPDLRLLWS